MAERTTANSELVREIIADTYRNLPIEPYFLQAGPTKAIPLTPEAVIKLGKITWDFVQSLPHEDWETIRDDIQRGFRAAEPRRRNGGSETPDQYQPTPDNTTLEIISQNGHCGLIRIMFPGQRVLAIDDHEVSLGIGRLISVEDPHEALMYTLMVTEVVDQLKREQAQAPEPVLTETAP